MGYSTLTQLILIIIAGTAIAVYVKPQFSVILDINEKIAQHEEAIKKYN